MQFTLPVLDQKYDSNAKEIISQEHEVDCEFDFSIDAQTRWEDNFPELAKTVNVFDYAERVKNVEVKDVSSILIALKLCYCFLIFKEKKTFREFTRMFVLTNEEYLQKLSTRLTDILEAINKESESKKKF